MAWHQLDTQAITWTNADLNVMKNHNKNKLLKFLFSSRKQTISGGYQNLILVVVIKG